MITYGDSGLPLSPTFEKPLNTLANQFSEWTMSPAAPSSVSEPLQTLSVHKPNNTVLTLAW